MAGESSQITILAVDDNQEALFALENLLTLNGYTVVTAENGRQAVEAARAQSPDLVLLDVMMPELDGLQVTELFKGDPQLRFIPIMLLTSRDSIEDILRGLGCGADDYLRKPYQSDELLARVAAVLKTSQLYDELRQVGEERETLRRQVEGRYTFKNLIGQSSAMRKIFELIEQVKDADVPVLITGESGTGKELVAHAIHYNSARRQGAFLAQNCSAFNENLLESELFGHVKGAFTGAQKDKRGLFEVADAGTFFLDEIGEMSPGLQAKLLRVLQEGTFTPVGSTESKKVDVRIIAATHRNLEEMIAEGTFRQDLFYRINVLHIDLPPLRERKEDIPLLVEHFLKLHAEKTTEEKKTLSHEALLLLANYDWPGNIRQLRNELERVLLMSGAAQPISPKYLSAEILKAKAQPEAHGELRSLKNAVAELEKTMIQAALARTGGNKSEASRQLEISRSNLIAKVKEYSLE